MFNVRLNYLAFLIFTVHTAGSKEKECKCQEMADKNFNQDDAENLDPGATAPQNLWHPKIFETFSSQVGTTTLAA